MQTICSKIFYKFGPYGFTKKKKRENFGYFSDFILYSTFVFIGFILVLK